ncbi:hypothetical protein HUU05_12745 [candidate division KSB1 bacterium]|nr:hypothetical protein [candidate division KSB1 bacterium]
MNAHLSCERTLLLFEVCAALQYLKDKFGAKKAKKLATELHGNSQKATHFCQRINSVLFRVIPWPDLFGSGSSGSRHLGELAPSVNKRRRYSTTRSDRAKKSF